MSSSRPVASKPVSDEIPAVPLTIEGYSVLHQMMRVRWAAWRQLGATEKAEALAQCYERRLMDIAAGVPSPLRPRVYFEEWDNPMISGIAWVSELIEIAGGRDIFAELSRFKSAKDRIVMADEVVRRAPDIIIGSWCGKKFRSERVAARPGFERVPAVCRGAIHEIKSPLILQPGPAALTDGLAAIHRIIEQSLSDRELLLSLDSVAPREITAPLGDLDPIT